MGNSITFSFLSPTKQREISLFQKFSIFKQINILQLKKKQISHLKDEHSYLRIKEQLQNPTIQQKILDLEHIIKRKICSDLSNAFWEWKKHIISLPYEPDFNEKYIPNKATPTQMNLELLKHCKKEVQSLFAKKLIWSSTSPWSYAAFYVNNAAQRKHRVHHLVINYKSLNKVVQWIRFPIPNKGDLLNRLFDAKILTNTNNIIQSVQNCIYSPLCTLRMEHNAFWNKKCSIRISKYYEWYF